MERAYRVLLLEDDANLGLVLQEHLKLNGYEVTLCKDGEEGTRALSGSRYDLCLVDVMMPKKDGFTFAREVRAAHDEIPLVFLTARSLKEDRIEGFRIGCDDYITKPFSVEELQLRLEAVLRRARPRDTVEATVFEIGKYRFDALKQTLSMDGFERKLTGREADLLRLLCQHMNRTLSRERALGELWGDEGYFSGRSMDVFVSKLRKYLKDDPGVNIISIHGKGLRLVVG
jgi:two-component system OmpR family response regulator